jgi:uncharacterized membrane protein
MYTNHNPASQPYQGVANGPRQGSGRLAGLTLGAATVTIGLIAGLFFDWAIAIMPSLAQTDDRTFVEVMQRTITTINNSPSFMFAFMGSFVFTIAAAVLQHRLGARAAVRWILAALALYLAAVLITMGVHVPINQTLESAGDPDQIADLAALRADSEASWTNAHLARTAAAMLSLAALCRALWLRNR